MAAVQLGGQVVVVYPSGPTEPPAVEDVDEEVVTARLATAGAVVVIDTVAELLVELDDEVLAVEVVNELLVETDDD